MKALQLIYSFFLGLALAAFAGIGVDTFYPRPEFDVVYPEASATPEQVAAYTAQTEAWERLNEAWSLNASMILLVIATMILIIALFLGERLIVLSNGLLLGGLFTLFYGVIISLEADGLLRFIVIAVALAVTVTVGWTKFRNRAAESSPTADGASGLEERVADVEQRLDALRRALQG